MSLSINTNNSAMVALESLNATTSALDATENTVSTGQKVATAKDGPAAYAIAQQMNGNISGLSAVSDGLSFAASTLSTTSTATSHILSTLALLQAAVTTLGNNKEIRRPLLRRPAKSTATSTRSIPLHEMQRLMVSTS